MERRQVEANPELVSLLDTLYRNRGGFKTIEDEMKCMRACLHQLCNYYDRHKLGSDTITCYEKADIILAQAEALWETDPDYSTMGMIIRNDTYNSWVHFKHCRLLMQLSDLCENKQQRDLLMEEWRAWSKLEGCFIRFWASCVDLSCRGATEASSIRIDGYISIHSAHIYLYQEEIAWMSSHGALEGNGALLQPTKTLFLDCCKTILQDCCSIEDIEEQNERTAYHEQLHELHNEALKEYKELPALMDNWIEARSKWSDEVSNDYFRSTYDRNTSEVLLKLSSIICSLD